MTNKDVLKECRTVARQAGLTFKRSNANLNGHPLYQFNDRQSGLGKLENCTLSSAYENVCSGYIESYNRNTGNFDGILGL